MPPQPTLDLASAVVVDFPLRGEWRALNTPAERVPSHGTDYFGQRYAYDFARLTADGTELQGAGPWRHWLIGVPSSEFFCWNQPIHAAFGGRVVRVGDGWPDRLWVRTAWELVRTTFIGESPRGDDYRPLVGNYVMVEGEPGVALYAHLRKDSVIVRDGQTVASGSQLGNLGNSGNTTMPHLHFHLMDAANPLTAKGLLCAFRGYERHVHGAWERVERGVPGPLERIRSVDAAT